MGPTDWTQANDCPITPIRFLSTIREIDSEAPNRRFGLERTGFARVELVRDDSGERLRVSLYAMPRYPIAFWAEPELVTRWSVEPDGSLHPPPPHRN